MYKVLVVNAHELGKLEQSLNELAVQGYEAFHAHDNNNRLIIIMKRTLPILTLPPGINEPPVIKKKPGRKPGWNKEKSEDVMPESR